VIGAEREGPGELDYQNLNQQKPVMPAVSVAIVLARPMAN
jgi:hypothetical protein